MTNERIIGKDLEGSDHVLVELLSQHLLGGPEKKPLLDKYVFSIVN
jgi:hypothetical protein